MRHNSSIVFSCSSSSLPTFVTFLPAVVDLDPPAYLIFVILHSHIFCPENFQKGEGGSGKIPKKIRFYLKMPT